MIDKNSFGRWLKQRRKALDLTQKELAQRAGCAEITLRKVEAGDLHPSAPLVASLARALGAADADLPDLVALARGVNGDFSARARLLRPQRANNLPAQLTPLIGRQHDIAAVRKRLLSDGARLVTLLGPPGVGKTRLALAVAEEVLEQFEHGAFFVRLGPVSDPALVSAAIARALKPEMSGPNPPELQLRAWLEDKHLLLVLDNFEHVVAAAPLVDDLLRRCPWLHVLVTSRQPLRIRGERQMAVRPLALPTAQPAGARLTGEDALRYAAVALFAERAEAVQADFRVDDDNAAAVAELCRRLDGLPLAIELVAARVKLLPPAELLARLHGPWLLSTDGLRDVSERQRTLRGAIGWSYDLLFPTEQILFLRLAVFVGGCTLAAAEMMCEDVLSPAQVLDGIASLMDKSLLHRETGLYGEPRYAMLETVREYGLERVAQSVEEQISTFRRFTAYYVSLAERSALYLRTHEQLGWIGRLTTEQNNLRAALSRALQAGWDEMALRLTSALSYYWHVRGFEAEGREWIRQVLLLAEDDPSLHQSIWYSQTLLGDAILRVWDADSTARRDLLYQALSRFEQQADDWGTGYSLQNLARLAYEQVDYDSARTFGERSLAIWQAARDAWGMSISHRTLALIAYQQADWQAWRMHLQQAADLARAAGDRWLLAPTLQYLGLDVWQRDGPLLGRAVVEESLAAFREIGNQVMVAALSNKLGEIARDQGDYSFAQESCAQAREILRVWPDDWEIAWNFYCLGSIAFKSGDLPGARYRFEECLCSFRAHEHDAYHWLEGFVLGHLACVDVHEGQLTRAAKYLERSWLLLAPRQETVDLSLTAFGIAELFRLQSQWSQAMACFRFSMAKLLEAQRAVNIADCLEGMAKICATQEQPAHSVRLLGAADGLRQRLGTPVPQIERADYGRCLSAAHRQIDSASFNELWAQGFGMTLPEVVAYAFDLTAQSGDQSPCAMLVASYQFS